MQTKAPVRQSARSPSRTAAARSPSRQPQTPACRRRPAIPRGQRCGDRSLRIRRRPAPAQRSKRSEQSAPPFGLTLIEMYGMRLHRTRNSGHFWLLSVFALLAFACFPVLARADSSHIQYESETPPSATGKTGPSAQDSSSEPGQAGGNTSGASRKASSGGGPSSTGGNGGNGQGSPPNGSGNGAQTGQSTGSTQATNGGSSPLVPILSAIAALAAISIGAVMMRQRRQRHTLVHPSRRRRANW